MSLTIQPISAAEHLAFMETRQDASFQQTPAWGRVKTEWRSESIGWYDGPQLVGVGLVLHRPVPKLKRYTLAYLPQGPMIEWSDGLSRWLDPLATYLRAKGAFAIRLGPPVQTHAWTADQIKRGIADPAITALTDIPTQLVNPLGCGVVDQLEAAGWIPQSPETGFGSGQPQFTYEMPLAGRSEELGICLGQVRRTLALWRSIRGVGSIIRGRFWSSRSGSRRTRPAWSS